MKKRDYISLMDYTPKEIMGLFELTKKIKKNPKKYSKVLTGQSLAMIFMKNSTRTRVSFEVGTYELGGSALFLSPNDLQLSRGETIHDTAKVLSRYVNGIMIRTFAHSDVLELAKHATVPVINGLTDFNHPCQALTDYYSVLEYFGKTKGLTFTYVGDGNNMAHTLLEAAPKVGMNINIICPPNYFPDKNVVDAAADLAKKAKTRVLVTDDISAADGSDVIYTDVWASMGQEKEYQARKAIFSPYQVNAELMKRAKKSAIFMHCLPAHRGDEVTDEVVDSKQSIVFDQAENRLHCQKAVMAALMGGVKF